jgi:hypothetical protein
MPGGHRAIVCMLWTQIDLAVAASGGYRRHFEGRTGWPACPTCCSIDAGC